MRTVRVAVSFFLITVFMLSIALAAGFVGSRQSDKYHYPSCSSAQKIKAENMIVFSSPSDAIRRGYSPCKRCNPPSN